MKSVTMVKMAAVSMAAICLMAVACQRTPTKPAAAPVSTPTAANHTNQAAKRAEAQARGERRTPKPKIIGGCEERCATPQKAATTLLAGLRSPTPLPALRQLFDWSILALDGDQRGDHWSEMWADRRQHHTRNQEIDSWLSAWISGLLAKNPGASDGMSMAAVTISTIAKRTDVVEMWWRHPAVATGPVAGRGEATWRILWTRRGYEWLISRIDTQPSKRPLGNPPLGSARAGHL